MNTRWSLLAGVPALIAWAFLSAGLGPAAEVPETREPASLKVLRAEYLQRHTRAQAPADNWYRMQLRNLLDRHKRAGNLTAALAVQTELENPDPTRALPADKPLPPDLAGIRSSYVLNAQRGTQPVDAWYRQQLEGLERSLVQQGDIAGAGAVRAVYDALAGAQPSKGLPTLGTGPVSGARPLMPLRAGRSDKLEGCLVHFGFDEKSVYVANLAPAGGRAKASHNGWTEDPRRGGVFAFDGRKTSLSMDVPGDANLAGDLTLAAWIKIELRQQSTILYKDFNHEFDFGVNPKGSLYFYQGDGKWEGPGMTAEGTVRPNEWTHVAAVRVKARNEVELFINGERLQTWKPTRQATASAGPILVGCRNLAENMFLGLMDDVMVYSRDLTPGEIKKLFEQGRR